LHLFIAIVDKARWFVLCVFGFFVTFNASDCLERLISEIIQCHHIASDACTRYEYSAIRNVFRLDWIRDYILSETLLTHSLTLVMVVLMIVISATFADVVCCRIKLRSYRTRVCGTCVASSYIRAFRYVCGQLRALLPSGRSAKSHLGEWIRVSS